MAAEDPDPSGIFAIALSDSEDDGAAAQDAGAGTTTTASHSRTGQSEEEFQAVRRAYRVKVENGEVGFPFPPWGWLVVRRLVSISLSTCMKQRLPVTITHE